MSNLTPSIPSSEAITALSDATPVRRPLPVPPTFRPLRLCANRHVQTLLGALLAPRRFPHPTREQALPLPDGDHLMLHDAVPESWRPGDPIAVLVHGLGGCWDSYHNRRWA